MENIKRVNGSCSFMVNIPCFYAQKLISFYPIIFLREKTDIYLI